MTAATAPRPPGLLTWWACGARSLRRDVLRRWWLAYLDRRVRRLAIQRLHGMSDRELKDIGVCRSQIAFAVGREAARDPSRDGRRL